MRQTCLCVLAIGFIAGGLAIGRSAALAQERPASPAAGGAKAAPVKVSSFIAPDFCAVVVLHPGRIIKSPVLAALLLAELPDVPADIPGVDLDKLNQAIQPAKVRRVLVFIDPFPGGNVIFSPALIVQFEKNVSGRELLGQIFKDLEPGEFAGQTYYKSQAAAMAKVPMAAYVADARTIVVAPEPTLRKMLRPKETEAPLLTQLRGQSQNEDVVITFVAAPAISRLEKNLGEPLRDALAHDKNTPAEVKTLLRDVKSLSLVLRFSGDTLARGQVAASDEAAAKRLESTLTGSLAMKKKFLDALRKNSPKDRQPELAEPLWDVWGQTLSGTKIERKEDQVQVTVAMPAGLAELSRKAAAQGGPAPSGRP
ncbi:MAG: hypothetical protein ABSG86_08090 [Thermoguttaceae bacterium]|jgi:hypothetical protein